MSTNPFDEENEVYERTPALISNVQNSKIRTTSVDDKYRISSQRITATAAGAPTRQRLRTSSSTTSNPFTSNLSNQEDLSKSHNTTKSDPAIWSIRRIDWPAIPSNSILSSSTYSKLKHLSQIQAKIIPQQQNLPHQAHDIDEQEFQMEPTTTPTSTSTTTIGTTSSTANSSYYGITGFMSRVLTSNTNSTVPTSSHAPSSKLDDFHHLSPSVEIPIALRKINPPSKNCVASSNGWIVAVFECQDLKFLSRWNVRKDHATTFHESTLVALLDSSSSQIYKIFLDPTGSHVIISNFDGVVYYLHASNKKVEVFSNFFNISEYLTSVAWDYLKGTESYTHKILLGTNLGNIYEYSFMSHDTNDDQSNQQPKLLSSIQNFISGIHVEQVLTGVCILVVTCGKQSNTKLHSLKGQSFHDAFGKNEIMSVELPGASVEYAHLKTCPTDASFVIRSDAGLYHGKINKTNGTISDVGLLPHENIKDIAITPHHYILLLDTDQVCFMNRVAKKIIQREYLPIQELFIDIRRPDQIWLRNHMELYHTTSSFEDRDVWKYSLEKCLLSSKNSMENNDLIFDHVLSLCTNSPQKAVVNAARAEYHLQSHRSDLAATYLAQIPSKLAPFHATALRLALPLLGFSSNSIKNTSNTPLILYLTEKLRLAETQKDNVQCTMLGAWIVELLLHEREHCVNQANSENFLQPPSLSSFLLNNAHSKTIDANTTIRLLSNHDVPSSEVVHFATLSGDVFTAVNTALSSQKGRQGAELALNILHDSPFEKAEPFYYKHALTLVCRAPLLASKRFLARFNQGLQATKLLPSFMQYESRRSMFNKYKNTNDISTLSPVDRFLLNSMRNEDFVDDDMAVIKYFEGVVQLGCQSTAIYDYLLSLYANMEDEAPLYRFLYANLPPPSSQPQDGDDPENEQHSIFDMSCALRTILKSGRHFRSAVLLYMGFGLRQQAVELALKVDPNLARDIARESIDKEEKKRLWLMIAKHASKENTLTEEKDIVKKVIGVLKDCGPDILSIEDVLPFLPDVAQIDEFKDEICDALTSYANKIDTYKNDLSAIDNNCDSLRSEIARLKKYDMQVKTDAKCFLSQKSVIAEEQNEPFYIFPSGFVFLNKPLKQHLRFFLQKKGTWKDLLETEQELEKIKNKPSRDDIEEEVLKAKYDGILAAECPLTGSIMVDSIDLGFGEVNEDNELGFVKEDESYQFLSMNMSPVTDATGERNEITNEKDVTGSDPKSTNPFD